MKVFGPFNLLIGIFFVLLISSALFKDGLYY